jgi:hypothetical protein
VIFQRNDVVGAATQCVSKSERRNVRMSARLACLFTAMLPRDDRAAPRSSCD